MNYAVIMAGGSGKRLWPLSRKKRPKQVLKILEGQTLLRSCYLRLSPMFDDSNIIILTNADYVETIRQDVPELPAENVIAEPAVRDTAGAIGLAAAILKKRDSDATMAVVTADQLIEPAEVLQNAIKKALKFVNERHENIVTFGIKPTFASTQFGYIKTGDAIENSDVCKVDKFVEKPDHQTAEKYLNDGQYLWNAGMFVWKVETILSLMNKYLPETTELLANISRDWATQDQQKSLVENFLKLPRISIDYAVMEKAPNVHTIKLDCKWLDMGSFVAMSDFINSDENNNVVGAQTVKLIDCKNNTIVTEDGNHLIACMGLENVVVAHSGDATFICSLEHVDRIKELLEQIESDHSGKYL